MMARTKRSRRSYGAGEWGRNRVRVFPDPKTGLYQIEWREDGRRLSRSLGHRDWSRANLLAVLNWAARSRDEEGRPLLESNPLKGLKAPKEKNPNRVLLTQAEYEALLRVSAEVDWRFRVALVIAHETGHRIGAIRQLRWSDIDTEGGIIRWRSEHEKTGYEHRTPLTAEALAALEEARHQNPGIGDRPVLPAPKDHTACVSRWLIRDWWNRAVASAGLKPKRGRGWHSLRRKFASDLMDQPPQGALRTRGLENGPDGASVLPARRRAPAKEGPRRPPQGPFPSHLGNK